VTNRPGINQKGGDPNAPLAKKRIAQGFNNVDESTRLEHSARIFSRVVHVGRVARMTGTGRKFQVRALIIMGNCVRVFC
jgi:ribosomal protein S5